MQIRCPCFPWRPHIWMGPLLSAMPSGDLVHLQLELKCHFSPDPRSLGK